MEPAQTRLEVMDRQLRGRAQMRRDEADLRREPDPELLEDLRAIREAVPKQGIASVRVSLGTVTVYGE